MKTKKSPLQHISSFLHSLSIEEFIPKHGDNEPFSMSDYLVDLNFDVLEFENIGTTNEFAVRIEININNKGKKMPGYVISLEANYIFQITADDLDEKVIKNLKGISATSIAIGKLRSDLERITQPYQFGAYIVPSIDMQDLFAKKRAQIKRQSSV